jgi:hypothetical protein
MVLLELRDNFIFCVGVLNNIVNNIVDIFDLYIFLDNSSNI